ncbi:hypothetical protein NR798_21115 [Archangium gephyra]|uniref:hypothetical protein n=1 Tax=Archangium gephyra TaxID=48 RepID=UPI0035D49875
MATRAKAAKKQVKAPTRAKKAAAKKSPARILLPSGVTGEEDKKKAAPRKSPARPRKSDK